MAELGTAIQERARQARQRFDPNNQLAGATERVHESIERTREYLRTSDKEALLQDAEAFIRAKPYQSLALGLGAGYLLGMIVRRKRSR